MITKTNEKGRFSGYKIVGRSAKWRTKREESKKRIYCSLTILVIIFFYALFCCSRGPFYIKSCVSKKRSPKKTRCSHSIWTCSKGLLTKLTGRSRFPTLFSGLFLRKWVGIRKSVGIRLPSFRTGGYTSTLRTAKLLLTRPPFQIYQNITYTFQVAELEGLGQKQISTYQATITENNINGKVLAACDLNELGQIMNMTFGDWQLFRAWVLEARNPSQDCMWYVLLHVFSLL